MPVSGPVLRLNNRQRRMVLPIEELLRAWTSALPGCLEQVGPYAAPLVHLEEVEASILSSREMARVHREFMNIPGPTDVITFPYGEILVCAEVARENAEKFGQSVEIEILRYLVHGLLHLNGFEDGTAGDREAMLSRQEAILQSLQL